MRRKSDADKRSRAPDEPHNRRRGPLRRLRGPVLGLLQAKGCKGRAVGCGCAVGLFLGRAGLFRRQPLRRRLPLGLGGRRAGCCCGQLLRSGRALGRCSRRLSLRCGGLGGCACGAGLFACQPLRSKGVLLQGLRCALGCGLNVRKRACIQRPKLRFQVLNCGVGGAGVFGNLYKLVRNGRRNLVGNFNANIFVCHFANPST